ncbi:hypothetical protein [Croceicoccus sp. YJ47]|nr:hypothetical protein [Croceicoccus sp. YJ47]
MADKTDIFDRLKKDHDDHRKLLEKMAGTSGKAKSAPISWRSSRAR